MGGPGPCPGKFRRARLVKEASHDMSRITQEAERVRKSLLITEKFERQLRKVELSVREFVSDPLRAKTCYATISSDFITLYKDIKELRRLYKDTSLEQVEKDNGNINTLEESSPTKSPTGAEIDKIATTKRLHSQYTKSNAPKRREKASIVASSSLESSWRPASAASGILERLAAHPPPAPIRNRTRSGQNGSLGKAPGSKAQSSASEIKRNGSTAARIKRQQTLRDIAAKKVIKRFGPEPRPVNWKSCADVVKAAVEEKEASIEEIDEFVGGGKMGVDDQLTNKCNVNDAMNISERSETSKGSEQHRKIHEEDGHGEARKEGAIIDTDNKIHITATSGKKEKDEDDIEDRNGSKAAITSTTHIQQTNKPTEA